jgi:hypothetical protein
LPSSIIRRSPPRGEGGILAGDDNRPDLRITGNLLESSLQLQVETGAQCAEAVWVGEPEGHPVAATPVADERPLVRDARHVEFTVLRRFGSRLLVLALAGSHASTRPHDGGNRVYIL